VVDDAGWRLAEILEYPANCILGFRRVLTCPHRPEDRANYVGRVEAVPHLKYEDLVYAVLQPEEVVRALDVPSLVKPVLLYGAEVGKDAEVLADFFGLACLRRSKSLEAAQREIRVDL